MLHLKRSILCRGLGSWWMATAMAAHARRLAGTDAGGGFAFSAQPAPTIRYKRRSSDTSARWCAEDAAFGSGDSATLLGLVGASGRPLPIPSMMPLQVSQCRPPLPRGMLRGQRCLDA